MESLASIYSNLLEQIKKSVYIRKEFNSHTFFFLKLWNTNMATIMLVTKGGTWVKWV